MGKEKSGKTKWEGERERKKADKEIEMERS